MRLTRIRAAVASLLCALLLAAPAAPAFAVGAGDGGRVQLTTLADDIDAPPVDDDGFYLIGTSEQLCWFRDMVNEGQLGTINARLTDNIDLSGVAGWDPIGVVAQPFFGTFDGGGHEVSGLAITNLGKYMGLFGYARSATVKDITVRGEISATDTSYRTSSNMPYVGGVVAYASASSITGCVSYVDITAINGYIGGIAGYIGEYPVGGAGSVVESSSNYGGIQIVEPGFFNSTPNYGNLGPGDGTSSGNPWVGGIVGFLSSSRIENCVNYGELTCSGGTFSATNSKTLVTTNGANAMGRFGGILGDGSAGFSPSVQIKYCANKADIRGDMLVAGGIVGNFANNLILTGCYNTGSIIGAEALKTTLRARYGGLLGSSTYGQTSATITNCYTVGTVYIETAGSYNSHAGELQGDGGTGDSKTGKLTVTNSFGPSSSASISAAQLGTDIYKDDTNSINGGYPLLLWESGSAGAVTYTVTFDVEPSDADVTVYSDQARTQEEAATSAGVYSLAQGTYYYTVSKSGYVPESGSVTVVQSDVQKPVSLYVAATVLFTVTTPNAELTVEGDEGAVAPAVTGNEHTYTLRGGSRYTWLAAAPGYLGWREDFTAADGAMYTVSLNPSAQAAGTIWGDANSGMPNTISEGGTYAVGEGGTGIITIATQDPVKLVGKGVLPADKYTDLYIKYTVAQADLTIQDLFVSISDASTVRTNMFDFHGSGNNFRFEGVNVLDMDLDATGYAAIHVDQSTSLTIGGATSSDTLYLYKHEQGSGIGGNGEGGTTQGGAVEAEYNGDIEITQGNIFIKGSKQGALIGSGANAYKAGGSPGSITIRGGSLCLLPIARGAAIGGAAGTRGEAGTDVYVYGGMLTFNVDYTGAAIGGGGYDGGNDALGGTLHYYGGSIRTFVGENAVGMWGSTVAARGVSDIPITADKVSGNSNENVYLLNFDTSKLASPATSFAVYNDGASTPLYLGELHKCKYVNEDKEKSNQISVSYTSSNWVALEDPNLYLYLTAGDHELTVNGESFMAVWDDAAQTFTVEPAGEGGDGEAVGNPGSGDLDGDGAVTSAEALMLARHVISGAPLTPAQQLAADIDGDGVLTMADAVLMLRKAAGL